MIHTRTKTKLQKVFCVTNVAFLISINKILNINLRALTRQKEKFLENHQNMNIENSVQIQGENQEYIL